MTDPGQNIWQDFRTPSERLEVNVARLAVILGRILKDVYAAKEVSLDRYEKYLIVMEEWSSALPLCFRYFPQNPGAMEQTGLSVEDEIASVGGLMTPSPDLRLTLFSFTLRPFTLGPSFF